MNHEISHTTAYIMVIAYGLILLATIPISEFLVRKLYKNKKQKD